MDGETIQSVDKRPLRVGLVLLPAALALTAMLLTGCGGSDDRAEVEAGLRYYLSTLDPEACLNSRYCEQGVFPLGAGVPQVKENSCKKIHMGPARIPEGLSAWSCVITYAHGKTALPVAVAMKGSGEVDSAVLVSQAPPLPPATVYEGGP